MINGSSHLLTLMMTMVLTLVLTLVFIGSGINPAGRAASPGDSAKETQT